MQDWKVKYYSNLIITEYNKRIVESYSNKKFKMFEMFEKFIYLYFLMIPMVSSILIIQTKNPVATEAHRPKK